jgi:hypothetical protein
LVSGTIVFRLGNMYFILYIVWIHRNATSLVAKILRHLGACGQSIQTLFETEFALFSWTLNESLKCILASPILSKAPCMEEAGR